MDFKYKLVDFPSRCQSTYDDPFLHIPMPNAQLASRSRPHDTECYEDLDFTSVAASIMS